jgi:hypothetical protein
MKNNRPGFPSACEHISGSKRPFVETMEAASEHSDGEKSGGHSRTLNSGKGSRGSGQGAGEGET